MTKTLCTAKFKMLSDPLQKKLAVPCYIAMRIQPHATPCMNLPNIMLGERSLKRIYIIWFYLYFRNNQVQLNSTMYFSREVLKQRRNSHQSQDNHSLFWQERQRVVIAQDRQRSSAYRRVIFCVQDGSYTGHCLVIIH